MSSAAKVPVSIAGQKQKERALMRIRVRQERVETILVYSRDDVLVTAICGPRLCIWLYGRKS